MNLEQIRRSLTQANGVKGPAYIFGSLLPIVVICLLFALQLSRGAVLYERWVQDIFIHMNGILHLDAGHRLHVDFSTPIGAFYYAAHYLTKLLVPLSAYTAVYANAFVALLAACLAILAGYNRLRVGWVIVLALYVGVLAMAPRQLGEMFISFNASYNRWGWAILAVLGVVISLPSLDAEKPGAQIRDGIFTACLVALLFFTKATFAVVGLGLIAVSLFTVRRNSRPWLYAVATAATLSVILVAVELKFGILRPYIADLQRASAVQRSFIKPVQLMTIAYITAADVILVVLIAVLAATLSGAGFHAGRALFLVALIGSGLATAMQNNFAPEIPLTPVVALIAFRLFAANFHVATQRELWNAGIAALVLLLFLRPAIVDAGSIVKESLAAASPGLDVDWLQTTPLRDLAFRPEPNAILRTDNCRISLPHIGGDREYLSHLHDAVRMVKEHASGTPRVFPLTWTNPFPVVLGSPPPRHELSWWDPGRSFNARIHPNAHALFRDVDFVLIPKGNYFIKTGELMTEIYGPEIERSFRPVAESACWRLMGRA